MRAPAQVSFDAAPSGFEQLGLRILLVFSFFNYSRILEVMLPWARLQLILATVALLAAISTGYLFSSLKTSIGKCLIALTVCFMLSIPLGLWPGGSFNILSNDWSKSFAVFLAVAPLMNRTSYALKTVYAWAFGCSLLPILTLALNYHNHEGRLSMPYGLFGNPNDLASAMVTGISLWMAIISSSKTGMFVRILGLLSLGPIALVLFRTGSRGGLIIMAIVITFTLMSFSMGTKVKWMFGAAMALAAMVPFVPAETYNRFFTLFETGQESSLSDRRVQEAAVGSAESREYLLRRSIQVTLDNPLFGVGLGMFEVADNSAAQAQGARKGAWHGTHNTYTQISSEAGIPALLCYIACLVYCWKALKDIKRWNNAANHPNKESLRLAQQALSQQLLLLAVAGCFAHFGYTMFVPNLAAVICGFHLAARREFSALAAAQRNDGYPASGMYGMQGAALNRPMPAVVGPAKLTEGSLLPAYRRQ